VKLIDPYFFGGTVFVIGEGSNLCFVTVLFLKIIKYAEQVVARIKIAIIEDRSRAKEKR